MNLEQSLILAKKRPSYYGAMFETHIFGEGNATKVYRKIVYPVLNTLRVCIRCSNKYYSVYKGLHLCRKCVLNLEYNSTETTHKKDYIRTKADQLIVINRGGYIEINDITQYYKNHIYTEFSSKMSGCSISNQCHKDQSSWCNKCHLKWLIFAFKSNIPFLLFICDADLVADVIGIIKDYYLSLINSKK